MASSKEIFQYLVGLNDDGNAISFNMETPETNLGTNFEEIFYPVEIQLEIKEGHNIQVFVAYDSNDFKSVGTARRGVNRIPLHVDESTQNFPRCQKMRIALREFSKSQCTIASMAVLYYLSEDLEEFRE